MMKQMADFSLMVCCCGLMACNQGFDDLPGKDTVSVPIRVVVPAPPVTLPYTATYTTDWEIGTDSSLIVKAMLLYKAVEENNFDSVRPLLADTIQYRTYDNKLIAGPAEDFIALLRQHRSNYASYSEEVLTYVTLHSKEKNVDWVPMWIMERVTRKNGKKDSTSYQESFRFVNGRITNAEGYSRYTSGR